MNRRRLYKQRNDFASRKIFCLDFEDPTKNTNRVITDSVTGIQLKKDSDGTIEFLEDYNGFGRAIKCNTKSQYNVYSSLTWSNIKSLFPNNFPHGSYTVIWFSNNLGTGTGDNRSGLMGNWNEGQITGWNSGTAYYVGAVGLPDKTSYVGYPSSSDVGMYAYSYDESSAKRATTMGSADTVLLTQTNTPFSFYTFTNGSLVFLRAQEVSYYFAAGGICAGICFYEGILTQEQLQSIFDAKKFL